MALIIANDVLPTSATPSKLQNRCIAKRIKGVIAIIKSIFLLGFFQSVVSRSRNANRKYTYLNPFITAVLIKWAPAPNTAQLAKKKERQQSQ